MDFLAQAQALAERIYAMTNEVTLIGRPELMEQDVDSFTSLMEKREPMIAKLTQLIKQDTSPDKNARKKLDGVIAGIVELDKKNSEIMKGVQENIAASLKKTRGTKKLKQAYQYPIPVMAEFTSGRLDAKQ